MREDSGLTRGDSTYHAGSSLNNAGSFGVSCGKIRCFMREVRHDFVSSIRVCSAVTNDSIPATDLFCLLLSFLTYTC